MCKPLQLSFSEALFFQYSGTACSLLGFQGWFPPEEKHKESGMNAVL